MRIDCLFCVNFKEVPTMSFSSKPKKIKAKGTFRELKIVHTVSRKGFDAIRTEEVKTPQRDAKNEPSTSRPSHTPVFSRQTSKAASI